MAANNDTAATGHCRKGFRADTIVLSPNSVQTLAAVNNANYGPSGPSTIRTQITIAGNGSRIRRTLQKATLTGRGGDAICNHGGTLNVVSSTISGNTNCGISAGGESQYDYNQAYGHVTISNSIISGNTGCGIDLC